MNKEVKTMKRYLVSVFTSQSYFKWIDAGSEDEAKNSLRMPGKTTI